MFFFWGELVQIKIRARGEQLSNNVFSASMVESVIFSVAIVNLRVVRDAPLWDEIESILKHRPSNPLNLYCLHLFLLALAIECVRSFCGGRSQRTTATASVSFYTRVQTTPRLFSLESCI